MKYPDDIRAESEAEDALMKALSESEFDKEFIEKLQIHLNRIGADKSLTPAKMIALSGYIFIEVTDASMSSDVTEELRPELILKALNDASNYEKIIERREIDE